MRIPLTTWSTGIPQRIGVRLSTLLCFPSPRRAAQVHRRRYALISGLIISFVPLLFGSLLPHIVRGAPLIDYPWTIPFLFVMSLTCAYTVRQREPGPIDVMLNRGFVYALLALFLVGVYKLFLVVLLLVPDSNWSQPILGAVLALIAALLLTAVRGPMQHWIDRLSYGGWYDYRTLVCTMSAGLSQVHDLEELVKQLTAVLRTMRFETALLLWPQGDALVLQKSLIRDPSLQAIRLPLDSALARYLQVSGRCLPRSQIIAQHGPAMQSLEPLERALLDDTRLHCWLPLVSRGELRGVLILGERQGEEHLAAEDLDILATLSRQAAVAAENVALIGLLRARLEQVEQMRDEIVEAQNRLAESREAERLHLAQELHDGPIQDLYGARFQIGMIEDELRSETSRAHAQAALATLQHVISALRSTCVDLRPPTLAPFGLEVAIRSHATRFRELQPSTELQLDLMHDGQAIPERVRLVLFRVCQESLNNIVKHARASWVLVRLEFDAEQIILEIRDDGCGFHVPQRWIDLARQGHLGLLGIAERVSSIGGTLEVVSIEGTGTMVRVTVGRELEQAEAATPDASVMEAYHDGN